MPKAFTHPLNLQTGPLRLEFWQSEDRIAHRLELVRKDRQQLLAESVETGEDSNWPPSPPFQEVADSLSQAEKAMMLVGMAGRSHWSAAITIADDALDFDIACRLTGKPGPLGSTYKMATGKIAGDIEPAEVAVMRSAADVEFCLPDVAVSFAPLAGSRIELNGDLLRIVPAEESTTGTSVTCRWRYRVSCRDL